MAVDVVTEIEIARPRAEVAQTLVDLGGDDDAVHDQQPGELPAVETG